MRDPVIPARQRLVHLLAATCIAAAFVPPAWAHHVTDFIVTSSVEGGGHLIVSYDFDSVAPLSFGFALGGASVYSGTNPGFDTADGDEFFPGTDVPYPIFPPGVPIYVVLTDNDGGRTGMKINGVTLAHVGDQAIVGTSEATPPGDLHRHPEWQLFLPHPEGTFGEGHISFKVRTTTPGYADSPEYTLTLSNGHLPPPEYAGDAYDDASVACQATVGKAVALYVERVYGALRRCLDQVQIFRARRVAGLDDSKAVAAAERACADRNGRSADSATMLGRLEVARVKAAAAIRKRCGFAEAGKQHRAAASSDFGDATIEQHLGLARCRVERLAAASYFRARTYLKTFRARDTQGGQPLSEYLPCVVQTAGEEEGPS
jgi:hypothetical protein